MTSSWSEYLLTQGATLADGRVTHFGDASQELQASGTGLVLADLSHFGLIGFSGEEAQTFLNGQITNAVAGMDPGQAVFAGYCSAKGRLLANFLVMRRGEDLLVMLPESLRESVQKRLSMFILRAKVKARDAGPEWVRLGLSGPGAAELLSVELGLDLPASILGVTQGEQVWAVRLGEDRFDLFVQPDQAPSVWQTLAARARPVGAPAWDALLVRAGIPTILPATQDQFVPQMANMDVLQGISFQKGCYPGQEIVARTQYLGTLKRRMFLARVDGFAEPGMELYGADLAGQVSGMVVNAAPSPQGGTDVLAVLRLSSHESGDVRLGSPTGPALIFQSLPYTL